MKKPRFSLKTKLLLFSVTILVIPWTGYQYVQGMESLLKSSLEASLRQHAYSIAIAVQQTDLLDSLDVTTDNRDGEHLYLRTLEHPINLDGYTDDWHFNQDLFQEYSEQHIIRKSADHHPGSLQFSQATGRYRHHLYAVFRVTDDHIVYRKANSASIANSDHLLLAMMTPDKRFVRYAMSTAAPGRLSALVLPAGADAPKPFETETRIQGVWQETAEGYTLEVRIPLSMIGDKLSFAINDVDDPLTEKSGSIIGSSSTEQLSELSTIRVPSGKLENLLHELAIDSSRIWIIDRDKRVLAISGSLDSAANMPDDSRSMLSKGLSLIYRMILHHPASAFEDMLSGVSKLNGREIETTLLGEAATSWRDTSDSNVAILTATYPLRSADKVIGAVMVEQNSQRIALFQNRAMEDLINLSLLVFIGSTVVIVIFAGRLTARIGQLRNQTERAINRDGRLQTLFRASDANDEIGDLSRTFADLLGRLHQYNRYLESMAGKLSHELRTPLSVVRSSLDNLEQVRPDNDNTYLDRAKQGIERLNNILNRLSEASRLEQAIQQADRELTDLKALLEGCVEGYRSAYPQQTFIVKVPSQPLTALVAPDLVVQLLDKLIDNAVDFSVKGSAVVVTLTDEDRNRFCLSIFNEGQALPDQMQENLFDSMVSVRAGSTGSSHLGLGLYIVRLITEFHHGHVEAKNLSDPDGVVIEVHIPTLIEEKD